MRRFIPLAMVFAVAACEKKQEAAQVPPSSPAAQTAPQAAPPPVTATEPVQIVPQTPASEQAAPTAGQSSGASGASGSSADYIVAEGDTLSGIARDHGLNSQDVANWNNLKDPNRIRQGQTLRLAPG